MTNSSSSNTGLIVGIVAITVLLFVGLVFLLSRVPGGNTVPGQENVTFSDAADPAVGPEQAKVTVHMYEDFECPACQVSHPIIKQVMEAYKDRVRFVWKDFPLESIHPAARISANAARCAQVQGKFWEYQDQLFQTRNWISASDKVEAFVGLARNVAGLNADQFRSCVASKAQDGLVAKSISEGFMNRVDATPTFFVGTSRVFAMPLADWKRTLDTALAQTVPVVAPTSTIPVVPMAPTTTTVGAATGTR
ncbi:thioredoxin domain-containing protein [Patescibacteria group bacterium]|nr:thioredoxin domain-containing protein [Patescibacteria group bacterium]